MVLGALLQDLKEMAENVGIRRIFLMGYSAGADKATLMNLGLPWLDHLCAVAGGEISAVAPHLIGVGAVAPVFALFTDSLPIPDHLMAKVERKGAHPVNLVDLCIVVEHNTSTLRSRFFRIDSNGGQPSIF